MRFPQLPRAGKAVSDTIREIINFLRASQITSVIGGTLKRTPNGSILDVSAKSAGASGGSSFHYKVSGAVYDSGATSYTVNVRGGHFLMRAAESGVDCFTDVIPYIDIEGTLTAHPPEETVELTLTSGQGVFLKVETDEMDKLKDAASPATGPDVQIVAASESVVSTHNQPIDDEDTDGTDGVYYYPIARLDIDGGDPSIVAIEQIQQGGQIIHTPPLWKGENVGAGAGIFKSRDTANNTYRFRSAKGGHGVAIEEASTEAIARQNNENVGGGVDVWTQPVDGSNAPLDVENYPDGTSKFRTIRQLYTDEDLTVPTPQISVAAADGEDSDDGDGDTVLIRGNTYVSSVSDAAKVSLSVKDGLVTLLSAGAADTGENLDLTVEKIIYGTADLNGSSAMILSSGPTEVKVLYWRDGLFVGDVDPEDSPTDLVTQTVTYFEAY